MPQSILAEKLEGQLNWYFLYVKSRLCFTVCKASAVQVVILA